MRLDSIAINELPVLGLFALAVVVLAINLAKIDSDTMGARPGRGEREDY